QPQPVVAEGDADRQEQQQAGQPHFGGRPGRDDAAQQHEAPDQQRQVQLLQGHFHRRSGRGSVSKVGLCASESVVTLMTSWGTRRTAVRRVDVRIGIAGAGAVGRSVARELLEAGHRVLLIERNVDHYAPHTAPEADWLLADACELASLQESGLQLCDVVIAATGDDKVNLAAALLAKTEFGVARVVARVNDLRNEWLFSEPWGVDVAVSAPRAMVAGVEGAIDVGHLVQLMGLAR